MHFHHTSTDIVAFCHSNEAGPYMVPQGDLFFSRWPPLLYHMRWLSGSWDMLLCHASSTSEKTSQSGIVHVRSSSLSLEILLVLSPNLCISACSKKEAGFRRRLGECRHRLNPAMVRDLFPKTCLDSTQMLSAQQRMSVHPMLVSLNPPLSPICLSERCAAWRTEWHLRLPI